MNNKPIHLIESQDFNGFWSSSDKKKTLYYDKTATLTINNKVYQGNLNIEYVSEDKNCTNCLKISIAGTEFKIKQINSEGFFLTIENGEVYLKK